MKKVLYILFILPLFITSYVYADTYYEIELYNYTYNDLSISDTQTLINNYSTEITYMFSELYNQWNNTYSVTYPYYIMKLTFDNVFNEIGLHIFASTDLLTLDKDTYNQPIVYNYENIITYNTNTLTYSSLSEPSISSSDLEETLYYANDPYNNNQNIFYYQNYFYSNFDLYFTNLTQTIGFNAGTREWIQEATSPIPTLYDFYDLTFLSDYDVNIYEEVDLSNYAYLVLSLNSYDNLISPVVFEALGQICVTPVYDYGMRQKGQVTDRCFLPYTSWTEVRYYIMQTDLDNKAVFYVTPYDTSITNKIKINTRVFSISYVTTEQASNPYAIVSGKQYPVLPYSSLTSSASINEENNFIPGQANNVFDVSSDSNFISTLFSNPLQALGTTWTAITTMFALIGAFIGLLPVTLQAFLFTAFALAICLGIIKILVGGA